MVADMSGIKFFWTLHPRYPQVGAQKTGGLREGGMERRCPSAPSPCVRRKIWDHLLKPLASWFFIYIHLVFNPLSKMGNGTVVVDPSQASCMRAWPSVVEHYFAFCCMSGGLYCTPLSEGGISNPTVLCTSYEVLKGQSGGSRRKKISTRDDG
jgi:hypothetical protein